MLSVNEERDDERGGAMTPSFLIKLKLRLHRTDIVHTVEEFDHIETALGQTLPADYKAFLMFANGAETLAPLPHTRFYALDELLERRSDGQPPDVLEFATDDSDGFAFGLRVAKGSASYPVVSYPLGDTERDEIEFVADGFRLFLEVLQNPASPYQRR